MAQQVVMCLIQFVIKHLKVNSHQVGDPGTKSYQMGIVKKARELLLYWYQYQYKGTGTGTVMVIS